jgi:transcriptional regulator with XRE-family HTH domain
MRREYGIDSQEKLAARSRVSRTTIKDLESGAVTEPRSSTLMLLARGFAADERGNVNGAEAEANYTRLMRAAGSWPQPREEDEDEDAETWEAFRRRIAIATGRTEVALAADTVVGNYHRAPKRLKSVLEELLLEMAEDITESKERAD